MRAPAAALASAVFFLAAPGTVAGLVPWWITRWRLRPAFGPGAREAGALLVAAGLAALVECFARFVRHDGTPAPIAPTERLVVSGLYRHVRNPMYVAVLAMVAGQGLLLGSVDLLVYAALLWATFTVFVIVYEEPTLARQHGAAYQEYRRGVGRWWPRLTPWKPR